MSDSTPVQVLLSQLFKASGTVSRAYYNGEVTKDDENATDIELLRRNRLLAPGIRDTFQLRSAFRHFLNTALSTQRLFAVGADFGGYFGRLDSLITEHSYALQEGRDAACEQYEFDIREAISDIADAIDDELTLLHALVETKFAAVSTIAEKRRQNQHYQARTEKLVTLLENFHFSDFAEQLAGKDDLDLAFHSLLQERIPAFREQLKSILQQLNQYLFEFRQIEERAQMVRAFSLHLKRKPDWMPCNWDERTNPPEWVTLAAPIALECSPDVAQPESEALLREIAATIPATADIRVERRQPGAGELESTETVVVLATPPIKKAVRAYFAEVAGSPEWISARLWWCRNPSLIGNVREDVWLLRLLAEDERAGAGRKWSFRRIATPHPVFDGNLIISDILAGRPGL